MKIFLKMCLSYLYAGIKSQNNLHVINLIKAFVNYCLQVFADKTIDIIPISKAACHCPSHENFRCLPFYRLAGQGSHMMAILYVSVLWMLGNYVVKSGLQFGWLMLDLCVHCLRIK